MGCAFPGAGVHSDTLPLASRVEDRVMHQSRAVAGISLLCLLLSPSTPGTAQPYAVVFEHNVPVKMRDGVTLNADIYRPAADGRFAVLLQRTPYNKDGDHGFGLKAAARGYVVVVQDVRGRYTSEGEWYPFKHESNDGYDTVEWAAALPHADGRVGMFGGSYVGATQMLTAIAHPPHLAGICPVVTASNYHANWTYQGGAFQQWFNQSWTSGLAQDTFARQTGARNNAMKGVWQLPLGTYPLFNPLADGQTPDATATLAPYYLDWLAHPSEDAYWKQWSSESRFSDITVPMLTVAAWYDLFQDGSLRNYIGVKAHGGTDAARRGQRLIVIVGGHAGNGPTIGEVDFGPPSAVDED
jgi:putative CocE/NonD family hydrolase